MKRKKTKGEVQQTKKSTTGKSIQSKTKKKQSSQKIDKERYVSTSFYDKYIAPYNIIVLISLILIIGIIAFGKYFTGEYLFFFKDIGSDSVNQDYPAILHKVRLMKDGFLSEWSFYTGMGEPINIHYPVDPYTGIRVLEQKAGVALYGADYYVFGNFLRKFFFSFMLTGVFFYYYLRSLSVKKFSSLIGALIMSFSGFIVLGSSWGFSGHVFKAVFLLFAFEQLYLKNRWYFFPFAFIWLSTNLFTLYIYTVFLLIYVLFRLIYENKDSLADMIKLGGKMIALGVTGMLMNMINIVPSFMKMFYSPRVSGNASYSEILSSGEQITEQSNFASTTALRFFSNDILGSGSSFSGWNNYLEAPIFYIGLLTLLIFPHVFIYLKKREKIVFGAFLGFWALTLIFPIIRHTMLAYTGDYFRYGFDFFIPFVLLFYGIYSLNKIETDFKLNYTLLLVSLGILILILFLPYGSLREGALDTRLRTKILILMLLWTVLLFLFSKHQFRSIAQILFIFLLVFELSSFSKKSYSERTPIKRSELKKNAAGYDDGTIDAVNYIQSVDTSKFYRIEKDYESGNAQHSSLNDAQAQGYYGTTSYSSFNQLNYIRFLEETGVIQKGDEIAARWSPGFRGLPLLQTFGNVKYHLSRSIQPEFIRFGFDSLARIEGITILKNRYALPFGYTYDAYINYADFKSLTGYQINEQTLTAVYTDLSRTVELQKVNQLLTRLQNLLNTEYETEDQLKEALIGQIGKADTDEYYLKIAQYATANFKNQASLLAAFVYEEGSGLDVTGLKKIETDDTAALIPAERFNFNVYRKLTDALKEDVFRITDFSQTNVKGTIDLSKKKLLFFTIPYDEGWKANVDGKTVTLSRVNIGFTGLMLEPGKHEIELYYERPNMRWAKTVSIVSIVLFWLYLGYFVYKQKKHDSES